MDTASSRDGISSDHIIAPVFRSAHQGMGRQLVQFLGAISKAREARAIVALSVGLGGVILVTAWGQIQLNAWNAPFYDAIAQKDLTAFGRQLLVFGIIITFLLALNISQAWLQEMIKLDLRRWLTRDIIRDWLHPGRATRLPLLGEIGRNPDQRIHEDMRHLTELSADLAIGLFQATLLLASFIGVLWALSANVVFHWSGSAFSIPGYMVWCALLYALSGSLLSWRIGRPLIELNAERYAREAELRFALVRVSEHADGIALMRGEADERQRLERDLDRVLVVMRALVGAGVRLTSVTAGYGWVALIVPVLVAAPGYFGGDLSFGGLMMVVGAFFQVQQALRWFVDNFGRIADWRATHTRIADFRDALLSVDRLGEDIGRITIEPHPGQALSFENLSVLHPTGKALLDERNVEITAGEHVLILGRPSSGKSTFLRAIAGLWPWGDGRIRLPAEGLAVLPQRPYLPLGSIRSVLTYPFSPDLFADEALTRVLERTGLDELTCRLDVTERWDQILTLDEQQRIGFARLLLHHPRWIVLDEAIDMLDDEHRKIILSILAQELASATVISIGRHESTNGFYKRVLHLRTAPVARKRILLKASAAV